MAAGPGTIPGVILAGGRGVRMGGDKALVLLGGRSLLAHAVALLSVQAGPLAINANGDPARFAPADLPVLPDALPGGEGPLAGILAAMDWAHGLGAVRVVTVPVDVPFFPVDLVMRLGAAAGLALAATQSKDGLLPQPVFGLWPVALRARLRAALAEGMRKITEFTALQGAALVTFDGMDDPFFNINTPADLAQAESRLRAMK